MNEFVESEILEGELKKIFGMFCLDSTCRGEFIRDFEVLIEDSFDGIGDSSGENILSIRNEFRRDAEDICSGTEEVIRKRSSSVQRSYSTPPSSRPELREMRIIRERKTGSSIGSEHNLT